VVMWGAEALKRDFDVSIVTTSAIDLVAMNSFYGTAVREEEVKLRQLPIPRILLRIRSGAAIRGALFERAIRRVASEYDVLFSASTHAIAAFPLFICSICPATRNCRPASLRGRAVSRACSIGSRPCALSIYGWHIAFQAPRGGIYFRAKTFRSPTRVG